MQESEDIFTSDDAPLEGMTATLPTPEAIAAAAEQPRQPTIPGLKPPFDFQSAWDAVMGQRREVARAAADFARKADIAKAARKVLEHEQESLASLMDEYDGRRQDAGTRAAAEANGDHRPFCEWERESGRPCPICRRGDTVASHSARDVVTEFHTLITGAELYPMHTELGDLLWAVVGQFVPAETIEQWSPGEIAAVVAWLESPTTAPRPGILGDPHEVSALAGSCRLCGTLLTPLAAARGLEQWAVGQLVGIDCPGEPAIEAARTLGTRHPRKKAKPSTARAPRVLCPNCHQPATLGPSQALEGTINRDIICAHCGKTTGVQSERTDTVKRSPKRRARA